MLHTVIFIGRSGCGKGTQARLLSDWIHLRDLEKHPILYVETGEKFRQFIRESGYSHKLSKRIYEKDLRQPNFLACMIWSQILVQELDSDMHIFFDGAPRSRPEAEMLTTAMDFFERERPTVVYLNVSRRWSEDKLLARGRFDDASLEKIDSRLNWFDKDVLPAIEYYKKTPRYKFIEVSGEQKIEKVHKDILKEYRD